MFILYSSLVVYTLTWNVLMYRIYQVISTVRYVYMAVLSLSHSHYMSIAHTHVDVNLKKPTFNERRITVEVYKSNFYKWERVHSAEAVDVATGISAKAKNYKSKSGAKEHARENLKAILLERGIICKD